MKEKKNNSNVELLMEMALKLNGVKTTQKLIVCG